ncbi:hypothetical protein RhiirA4_466489 [Rhizophagus irregularis]|uniref:MULE transposase domain-containing protein n=1 Tax=Rhizophagus irregularis TaxID=588596 RepID=A0A2I1GU43_9GLOM|nr:hypothetical protein RhiirA4_466489 [Rhizophagus irregularis]
MFAAVFSVMKEDTNSEICFHHIDGKEIGCILADTHSKQALGLEQYLNNRYSYLSAIKHLKHIYKICLIHFNRNIRQKSEIPTEIKRIMYAISHLETKAEVLNVLEQIKLTQNKQAIDWVNDKSKKWVLANIFKAFTLMPIKTWNFTRFDTNVSESAHANVNRDGISLLLFGAIYR